ncbi:ParB/RepB/Spo0J family partition protein [Frigoriglobus tundricola]|uniref:ParB-like N-terminal domain-containing protein n=1 Tax=Frigoriglobus tundricola TaxID=2774151 RepID=A0A6M5YLY9_9BACT|nr:ParB/RepB/Spo0J family partition protein [Frigoriglobus tundricola]QJW94604.1 hypothetical protein FTUN_2126 [Frigoriglobus tundricola]
MKKKRPDEPQPTTARLENLRLADLRPHPDQGDYFPNYGKPEREALKADIRVNKLKHPIVVLPPGNTAGLPPYTILEGHTRREILLELGETKTEALVRFDLIDAPRAAVDEIFLSDNNARRHPSKLDQARVAVGLYKCRRAKQGRSVSGDLFQREELRDQIGAIFGMSGRNLARYLSVLAAPIEVQNALEAKKVKLVDAAKVAAMSKDDQARLAARLQAGEDARAVFAAFFGTKSNKHVKTADAVACLARSLNRAGADFTDRLDKVKPGPVRANADALRAGAKLIRALLERIDAP